MTISVNVNPPGSGLAVTETTRVGTINATFTSSSSGETITSTTSTNPNNNAHELLGKLKV